MGRCSGCRLTASTTNVYPQRLLITVDCKLALWFLELVAIHVPLLVNQRPPLLRQVATTARIALLDQLDALNPIDAEGSEILAQLAPSGDEALGLDISEHDRPDDALGLRARWIAIGDMELELLTHGLAQQPKIDRL